MKTAAKVQAFCLASVIFVNGAVGGAVYANEAIPKNITADECGIRQQVIYVDDNEEINFPGDRILSSGYDNVSDAGYMYNMLNTDDEREFYNRLLSVCQEVHDSDEDFEKTSYASFMDLSLSSDQAREIAWIFHYDHPEFYWMNSSMRISSYYGISFYLYEGYQDGISRRDTTEMIESVKDQYISGAMEYETEYDRAEYLFNALIENVIYEPGDLDQSAASAFLEGKTVCAGYSKAYSLLCNSVGVEAVMLIGYNHGWNAIRLSDTWYLVDVTNGMFLYSDDEMHEDDVHYNAEYQMTYTNSNGEEETLYFYMHDIAQMKYPVYYDSFPKCPYSYNGTDGKTAATTTTLSGTTTSIITTTTTTTTTTTKPSTTTTTTTTTKSSTITTTTTKLPETTAFTTSTIPKTTSATTSRPSLSVSAGDITLDNVVDISDATFVLEAYAKNAAGISVLIYDIQKEAGDVNGDGILDISDATLILEYYAYRAAGIEVS